MRPKLSICIPTYNRAPLLKECLGSVLPQVNNKDMVEVIVVDNASPDDTKVIVEGYMSSYGCPRYHRNPKNMGYTGNQLKCIDLASGDYVAFLCDDDAYASGEVDEILRVLSTMDYAFVALNYYSFIEKLDKPYKSNFAPDKDVTFSRAYDVLNYPSVGHYSGFVFNRKLATETLKKMLHGKSYEGFERFRGIIGHLAARSILASDLPAYFIGRRGLANRVAQSVDYDNLYHQCLDYYQGYLELFDEGLIGANDLNYRARLVIERLPRAIISNGPALSSVELTRITDQLSRCFTGNWKYETICYPLLRALEYSVVKNLFRITVKAYRLAKRRWYKWNA